MRNDTGTKYCENYETLMGRDGETTLLDIKETRHKGFLYHDKPQWEASVKKIRNVLVSQHGGKFLH